MNRLATAGQSGFWTGIGLAGLLVGLVLIALAVLVGIAYPALGLVELTVLLVRVFHVSRGPR
ncbi:MAG TPA: hypothetical protein VIR57_15535 [Chloroflexota bacterium]